MIHGMSPSQTFNRFHSHALSIKYMYYIMCYMGRILTVVLVIILSFVFFRDFFFWQRCYQKKNDHRNQIYNFPKFLRIK